MKIGILGPEKQIYIINLYTKLLTENSIMQNFKGTYQNKVTLSTKIYYKKIYN